MPVGTDLNGNPELTFGQKIWQLNWGLILLIGLLGAFGCAMLYSAAGGAIEPWASRHAIRFAGGLMILLAFAVIDVRFWFRNAYLIYLGALGLLVAVEFVGITGMGAQRWIDLKVIQLQPSEIMKVAVILALARYFHGVGEEEIGRPLLLLLPAALVLVPAALVLRQPDLGTAGMLLMAAIALFFLAGVRLWKFALGLGGALAAIPLAWQFLPDYQRQRVLTFLNPENDPLGAGYHTLQSKIAFGSGGLFGKGFLEGTQSHLNFLPEKQTDFIFTMLAEEFGFFGGIGLLLLFLVMVTYGIIIASRCHSQFGRLLGMGVTATFFFYVFFNIAMVMGLIPVVGLPLPLISYGGSAMLTLMFGFGLLIGVHVHRDVQIGRRPTAGTS